MDHLLRLLLQGNRRRSEIIELYVQTVVNARVSI